MSLFANNQTSLLLPECKQMLIIPVGNLFKTLHLESFWDFDDSFATCQFTPSRLWRLYFSLGEINLIDCFCVPVEANEAQLRKESFGCFYFLFFVFSPNPAMERQTKKGKQRKKEINGLSLADLRGAQHHRVLA